jgi:hypothetical protein
MPAVKKILKTKGNTHLTSKELQLIGNNMNLSPAEIHSKIEVLRKRQGKKAPAIQNIRKALNGNSYRRGVVETRGRKKTLSKSNAIAINKVRKELIKNKDGQKEVCWKDILKKARVPSVSPTTAKEALHEHGFAVACRRPREKPVRTAPVCLARKVHGEKWSKKPESYFTDDLDLTIDNKKFPIPTSLKAKAHLNMEKIRWHLRTRAEGLSPGFVKPNNKRHRINPGASASVLAGIIGGRVRIWEYLPKKWNGATAAAVYRDTIIKALRKFRGKKDSYSILEDNDPSGYKSNKAIAAKKELGIRPVDFPPYSPDLQPLDFFLWAEVMRRMALANIKRVESKEVYMARLRRTAMAIPKPVIIKAMASMKKRAKMVADAKGGNIKTGGGRRDLAQGSLIWGPWSPLC